MIKVNISNDGIVIKGHADFADYGKDIVCAAASSIVITSINACLNVEENSLEYKEEPNKLTISINSKNEIIIKLIKNMIGMLEELATNYPKNIKIEEERQ